MGWAECFAAGAVFLLSHSLPVRPPLRPWLLARLGRRGFTFAYSALSLAALGWLIAAAGRAPHVALWERAAWQSLAPITVMAPVCLILALSVARPNPFSFGGARNERFDPARPGMVRLSRHPLLLTLALWAGAHVLPNGDLAHVALFGGFTGFAVLGGRLIDRRKRGEMGADWFRLRATVAAAPLTLRPFSAETALRLVAGMVLYAALLWAHPILFGVDPLA